jgi:hypothetical protein
MSVNKVKTWKDATALMNPAAKKECAVSAFNTTGA